MKTLKADRDVEKLDHLYIAGENIKGYTAISGKEFHRFLKASKQTTTKQNMKPPYYPELHSWAFFPEK